MASAGRGLFLAAVVLCCSAHVGSPDAWYEGPAGPYHVLVHVEVPQVVPGIAVINVRADEPAVRRVTAFVNRFDATGSPPPPEIAAPLRDRPGWFRTRLWVMTSGSNSVTIGISGTRGEGLVAVPLTAVAARRLALARPLAGLLLVLGAVLLSGFLTIVGAAVREGVLPPGVEPDARQRRRARFAMARAFLLVSIGLTIWVIWWRATDRRFAAALFRPMTIQAGVDSAAARLTLRISDSLWLHRHDGSWLRARHLPEPGDLIEEHGKLMHLFLIATGGREGFAHLHPTTLDSVSFASPLPPLPPGTYSVFADVVQESGFTQTLSARVILPARRENPPVPGDSGDPDDSWSLAPPEPARRAELADGTTLTWLTAGAPLRAGEPAELRFAVGLPAPNPPLEPYLGMAGHAAVVRDDDSVFIHLHPLGTISPAAQARFLPVAHAMVPHGVSDTLSFPYAFPKPGRYAVWVQFKRGGRVLTAAFSARVEPAAP